MKLQWFYKTNLKKKYKTKLKFRERKKKKKKRTIYPQLQSTTQKLWNRQRVGFLLCFLSVFAICCLFGTIEHEEHEEHKEHKDVECNLELVLNGYCVTFHLLLAI